MIEIIDDVTRCILRVCQLAEWDLKDKIPSDEWKTEYLKSKQSFILLNLTNARHGLTSLHGASYGINAMQQAVDFSMRLNSAIPLIRERDRESKQVVEIETIAFVIDTVFNCIQAQLIENRECRDAANREFMRGFRP